MSAYIVQSADAAVSEWRTTLGEGAVARAPENLDKYARTTQAKATRPCCILYPETTEDVQAIVQIASDHGVPVYPISCGKNWGYGDACAPTDGAAIVDLGRMNRILEVNTELAYCVIEPGVTQGQLFEHLQDNDTGLWMDASAAGPESSLVGNTVERGFGHTRYGDHFQTCSGMEIVLADGRVLNTGFGHFPNAKATHVYPYGVGPYLDGLFTQSNYGIVTKIGLWLMPEPEAFNFFYFQVPRFEDIEELVDRIRPLRMAGTLDTAIHIGNDFRVLAGSGKYPWDLAKGVTPLPPEVRQQLRRQTGAQAWQGSGSITGTKAHVRAARKALKKALRGCAGRLVFLDDRKIRRLERTCAALNAVGLGKKMARSMKIVRPNYDLLKGVPTVEPIMGAYWRLRKPPDVPGEPLDSGCGLYWVSPVIPMKGSEAIALLNLAKPIFEEHGFDMVVSLILLTERCLVGIFNVAFDKSLPEEADRASACYEALVDAMMARGYNLYRAGLQGMPKIRKEPSVFWEVAAEIKRALDPKDIISRGRYNPPLDDPPSS